MAGIEEIKEFLDGLLDVSRFNNDRPNGLLVKETKDIGKIALASNTTVENIEKAGKIGADMLLVHHGGWEETDCDMYEKKNKMLKEMGICLYIAHSTLDCNREFGIAASLAKKLGVKVEESFAEGNGVIGIIEVDPTEFKKRLISISRNPSIHGNISNPNKAAIIGGGGASSTKWLCEARKKGCDVYVTGDGWFFSKIYAHEAGMALVLLGETDSEKWGIYSLGEKIKERFKNIEIVKLEERSW